MNRAVIAKVIFYIGQVPDALRSVVAEMSLFLLMVSCLGVYTICEDLALEKACHVNLNFTDEICDSIRNRNESLVLEEAAMQRLVSTVKSAHAVVDYGVPIILMMFLGPLSDVFGRKIPMLMCVTGYLMQYGGAILSAYITSWDLWTFKFILSTTRAIGGGEAAYNMAAMAYITDTTPTNPSLRTVRTGILYSFFIAGVPVGSAYGAYLSSLDLGYVKSLSIASVPGLVAFFIVLCFVKNTRNKERSKEVAEMSKCQVIKYICNPKSTWVQIWKTLSKKREGFNRLNIFAVLVSHFCVMAPMSGVILSMGILSYYFKLSDAVVGFVSGISQFTSCFLYTFARTSLMMHLAPILDMMNGTMIVVNKSILSKLVNQDEVGNLFAFVGVVDSVSPLVLVPTYNALYKSTFLTLPGTFYLLSAGLTIPAFVVFGWLIYWDFKKEGGCFERMKPFSETQVTVTYF